MYKWMFMLLCAVMLSACDKPATEQPTTDEKPQTVSTGIPPQEAEAEPKVELNEQERAEIKQAATSEAAAITADNAEQEADKLAKEIEGDL